MPEHLALQCPHVVEAANVDLDVAAPVDRRAGVYAEASLSFAWMLRYGPRRGRHRGPRGNRCGVGAAGGVRIAALGRHPRTGENVEGAGGATSPSQVEKCKREVTERAVVYMRGRE